MFKLPPTDIPQQYLDHFTCQRCGACCRWPGVCIPSNEEIDAAAKLLQLSIDEFMEKYVELSPDRTMLIYRQHENGACIFLAENNDCIIYPARPKHCRTYPYEWNTQPDFQLCCPAQRQLQESAQPKIQFAHVLGHPSRPLDISAFPADAQVLNCRNICLLLEHLAIPYAYYGCPGSILPGKLGTFVDCGKPTGIWKYRNSWHKVYNRRLSRHLKQLAHLDGTPEIILSLYGAAQSDIDALGLPVIEPMVGYDHCWAPYRVFPSYAQQNIIYTTCPTITESTKFFDTVIPHFLPAEDYQPPLPSDKLQPAYLLYIGRNAPDKGISIAEEVARAAGMPLLKFHDGLTGEKKISLLTNARAVIMPTLYLEPFGYVAIESQLCGTPVITTDWGAFAETVIHGVTGFRCRTQAEFVRAAVDAQFLNNKVIRNLALDRYSLQKNAQKYDNYFRFVWNVCKNGGYYAYAAYRKGLSDLNQPT